jgi:hypothetical protein
MVKIAVLGLGSSIEEFDHKDFSIGCNDIWKYHHSEAVVVCDYPKAFTVDRLKTINDSKPEIFYSQIVDWDTRVDFKKIDIIPGYPNGVIDLNRGIYKSFCSPYVAVQIAYKYHFATEIHLYGVDLINHPNLISLTKEIKGHFQYLKMALELKGCKMVVHGNGILKDL